jgi:hypothetical protein
LPSDDTADTWSRTPADRAARRLGDFALRPRALLIAALSLAVGALSAVVALALLRLIGLITNLVFYGRFATGVVASTRSTRSR